LVRWHREENPQAKEEAGEKTRMNPIRRKRSQESPRSGWDTEDPRNRSKSPEEPLKELLEPHTRLRKKTGCSQSFLHLDQYDSIMFAMHFTT